MPLDSVTLARPGNEPPDGESLIEPQRSPKGTRLYSQDDVARLRRIQEMTGEMGLNLAGVELVLELERRLQRALHRAEVAERKLAEIQSERGE